GVAAGSPGAGASGASGATGAEASRAAGADTDAADAIVAAARREDRLPLVVVCAGPLTNVAEALRRDPGIAGRFTLSWVGGTLASATAGGEYNLDTDRAAAEHALAAVGPALRRFPLETYRRCAWSVPQLEDVLTTQGGALGAWLWRRFLELPLPEEVEVDAVWPLGDSCPLVGTALSPESSDWRVEPDGSRVCTRLDDRLVLGDLTALLRRHARQASRPTDTAADLQTHPTSDGSPS
ncbi:MAG TPA: hypothetical protein DHV14_07520, partial [Micrococcales bacterium]|uniref:nucleoside hydrolase n=1 Tax=Miniimonas arenae TaxID=676201 RepID=UPI000EBF5BAF